MALYTYTKVGETAHFIVSYEAQSDPSLRTQWSNWILTHVESDLALLTSWWNFQLGLMGEKPPLPSNKRGGKIQINLYSPDHTVTNAVAFTVVSESPGEPWYVYEIGYNLATGPLSTLEDIRLGVLHELMEVFAALQNKGWSPWKDGRVNPKTGNSSEGTNGEGLSKWAEEEFQRVALKKNVHKSAMIINWFNAGRPDYINHVEVDLSTEEGFYGEACTKVFLNWLRYQYGFTAKQILAHPAPTPAGVWKKLTGKTSDPFPIFKAQLDKEYPPGSAAEANIRDDHVWPDNPYPLATTKPPQPKPKPVGGNWPLFSEIALISGDGQSYPRKPVNTDKTEESVFRNGQWVEFWSKPGTGVHLPVADFAFSQSGPSQATVAQPTGVTTVDGPQTVDATVTTYTVSFNGSLSYEINGRIVSWEWNFGDGSPVATGSTVNHAYTGIQTFPVKLTVTDALGTKASVTKPVTISATPISQPRASIISDLNGYTVNFDGTRSSSTNGATIIRWQWAFGDGGTGLGPTTSHTYPGGSYTATLTVTDSNGYTAKASVPIKTNVAPIASFNVSASNLAVNVDASASTDPDGTIASYGWDFGDGTDGTGKTETHTYATNGTYSIKLTVTDNQNTETTAFKSVTVSAANANPVASFIDNTNGLTVNVDGSASSDPNGTVTAWAWNFGDGSTGSGKTASHTYASAGTRTVTLTVTDDQGATGSTSKSVTVVATNTPPVPSFTATTNTLTVNVDGSASTDPGGSITAYAWTFGDGGTATGVTASHTYASPNTYTIKLTVTDNQGLSASTTKAVTVSKPATDYIIGAATGSSTLHPGSANAVLQQLVRSPDTGEFYSSQVHTESNGFESVRISRMQANGTFIDNMLLTDAGHGTTFALEYSGGKVYIWLNWHRATDGVTVVDDLVRFPYAAGTFTRSQVAGLTVKAAGPTYRLAAFDYRGGFAVVTNNSGHYIRYALAKVLAGDLSAPLNTINLAESPPTLQGFATYYDSFFRYTGVASDAATRSTDKPTITEYSWATGKVVRTIDTSSFGGTATKTEPEGLSIYNTGNNPVLFFGVTQGPTGGPHTYPTWWYPLYNPDPVNPKPPPGNDSKSPWKLGSETEGLPSSVRVVKWSDLASSSSDNNNPMVAINRLTAPSVIDISGEQLKIPNFALLNSSTSYFPTGITHRYFNGFIGGINNGVFDNQVTLQANVMTSAQLSYTANQKLWDSTRIAAIRPSANSSGTGSAAYFMGVHFVGADQGRVTEANSGWQYQTGPARYVGFDLGGLGNGSIFQNCLTQGFNYSDGSSPPYEDGCINFHRTSGSIARRCEMDGQLPVGSPSRPTSSTVDPYGHNWKRSGGWQYSGDKSPRMYDVSVHSGLVSGLTFSIAGTSNNGSSNSADIYGKNLYIEDQSTRGFSGVNLEDILTSFKLDNPTIKMNGSGGYHIKFNPYLQAVAAPNISSSNFVITEPTWSGLGFNGMFAIGIAKWGSVQTSAPTVIKNGVHLTGTTSTTADPTRFYHIHPL